MIFLDTNIFIGYFEQLDILKSKKIEELFVEIVSGKLICFTNSFVIAEISWVLEKYYGWDKEEICDNIEFILNTPNLKIFLTKLFLKNPKQF